MEIVAGGVSGGLSSLRYALKNILFGEPWDFLSAKLSAWTVESYYADKDTDNSCNVTLLETHSNAGSLLWHLQNNFHAGYLNGSLDKLTSSIDEALSLVESIIESMPLLEACTQELSAHFDNMKSFRDWAIEDLARMQHNVQVSISSSSKLSEELAALEKEMAYYRELQTNYSTLKSTKLELAMIFTAERHAYSLAGMDRFITEVTDSIMWPIKNIIITMKSEAVLIYKRHLQQLVNITAYYRQGSVEASARARKIFRQPYFDTNTDRLLVYALSEREYMPFWPQKVDLVSYTRDGATAALVLLIDDYLRGILQTLQDVEAGMRSAAAGVTASLDRMEENMQTFHKLSLLEKDFIL